MTIAYFLTMALCVGNIPARAETPPFEEQLIQLSRSVASQREKDQWGDLAREISLAAVNIDALQQANERIRFEIADVRRHAGPGGGHDPTLPGRLQQLSLDLRDFYSHVDNYRSQVDWLTGFVRYKDPTLLQPAQQLHDAASRLKTATDSTFGDLLDVADDVERAGLGAQARSVRQQAYDIQRGALLLEHATSRLLYAVGR